MFIDRIFRINHTETWNFNTPTLVTSVSHKITAKCGILCPKTLLLTEKQLHAIHFFVATRNVCPLAIPESCAQNMGIRLLENHSFQRNDIFSIIAENKSQDSFAYSESLQHPTIAILLIQILICFRLLSSVHLLQSNQRFQEIEFVDRHVSEKL